MLNYCKLINKKLGGKMSKKLKGFDRLRKVITLGAVGSAGLLGMGTGRAGSTTNTCTSYKISVSNVVTLGTSVSVRFRNATIYAQNVLGSTSAVAYNIPGCASVQTTPTKGGSTSSSTNIVAFGISEASIFSVSHSWNGINYSSVASSGVSSTDTLNDAFDGYGGIFIDGAPYNDTDGQVDITGTTLTTDPATMLNGLNVSSQYHQFTDKRVIRIIHTLENPTNATVSSRVAIGGNLGSDSNTFVPNTSDGDQIVEQGDTWVITHDELVYGGEATEDPILTHVVGNAAGIVAIPLQIPGEPIQNPDKSNGEEVKGVGFNDNISFGYDMVIPAGETQEIVWFVHLGQNLARSNAFVPNIVDSEAAIAAGLYANLPVGMASTGANWGAVPVPLGPAPTPAIIPVFSPISLVLLSGMFGFAASRRFRKVK